MSELRAPVQGNRRHGTKGTIAWAEHLQAWNKYHERHRGQSAERIAERGGFGYGELLSLLGYEPKTFIAENVDSSDQ